MSAAGERALMAGRARWYAIACAAALMLAAALLIGRAHVGRAAGLRDPAAALTPAQKAAVEATVREYILAHPEIIPQAITALQARSNAQLLASSRAELERPYGGAWAGAAGGDVTLVEFFDYACPYCRAVEADLNRLVASDPHLKVVYRDFPVITAASGEAALASLSAARQGPERWRAFHAAMFAAPGHLDHEKVVAGVRAGGLNEAQTARDLQAKAGSDEIAKNIELGRALSLTGTPAFIVGDQILLGAKSFDDLKAAVAAARDRRPAAG